MTKCNALSRGLGVIRNGKLVCHSQSYCFEQGNDCVAHSTRSLIDIGNAERDEFERKVNEGKQQ
jgi:hypothetical protein